MLVVDDNATNRRILEEVLSNWGMRPRAVDGGAAALAVLAEAAAAGEPFPLVLLDGHMPEMDGFALAGRIQADPALAGATVLMLTSAGQPEDVERCRQLGIRAYLTKPVRQSELLETILATLGGSPLHARLAAAETLAPRPAGGRCTSCWRRTTPSTRSWRMRLLRKQGHTVVVANNGREAVEALEKQTFDLVLMDVQMPEMDGFEATAAIRRREAGTGRRMPIIAMTAHAMKGDRERCLEAGMDGYVSKPIQTRELYAAIAALGPGGAGRRRRRRPTARRRRRARCSIQAEALARVGGDWELLRSLTEVFFDSYPAQLAQLREAIGRGDAPTVYRLAHTLVGAVGIFRGAAGGGGGGAAGGDGPRGDLTGAEEA